MDRTAKRISSVWTAARAAGAPVLIGGHRGASSAAAENSSAAFEMAIAAKADFIEVDWRLTRDSVPVAFHDDTLARLRGDPRRIDAVNFAELKAIHPEIMTIPDVLNQIAGRMCILLDTKITAPEDLARGLDLLAPALRDDTVAFGTRSLEASRSVRARFADAPVLGLFSDYSDYPALRAMGGQWARLWENAASAEAIAGLQRLGLRVIVMAGKPATVGEISGAALTEILRRRPDAVMLNDLSLGLATRAANISSPADPEP